MQCIPVKACLFYTFIARANTTAEINCFLVCGSPVEYPDIGFPATEAERIETATTESTGDVPVAL